MLRLALIENLRRVVARITPGRARPRPRGRLGRRIDEVAGRRSEGTGARGRGHGASNPPTASAFVAELARRLQGQSPRVGASPLTWVEQRLADSGQTIEQMVQASGQQQAADQVSIGNSIGSLRLLARPTGATSSRR